MATPPLVYVPMFTLASLAAIEEAILSGATSVSYEGKSVTYRSLDDLLRLRGILQRALGVGVGRPSTLLAQHSRGVSGAAGSDE